MPPMDSTPAGQVGFIGLGKMGRPMATHLLNAGVALVVHNRSQAAVNELSALGASAAESSARVSRDCEAVFTCLPSPESVESVYFGQRGLLGAAAEGRILVDLSTVSTDLSRRIHEACAERGVSFLDAPISGGTAGAGAATLTIMAGGDRDAFDTVYPLLRVFGPNVHHVGPSGAGSSLKLVNQLLVAVHTAVAVEAIVLGARAGLEPAQMREILATSFGRSEMLVRTLDLVSRREFAGGSPIKLLLKDLDLILNFGRDLDTRLLLGATTAEIYKESRALGLGDEDMVALVKAAEHIAGIEVGFPAGKIGPDASGKQDNE